MRRAGDRSSLPSEQPDHVQRGAVSLLKVLEDDHSRRAPRHLPGQRSRDLVGLPPAGNERLKLASRRLRYLEERPQRSRGEQRIARAPENARRGALSVAEASKKRGFPHTRFAADEHQAPARVACHISHARIKRGQVNGPLEQLARIAQRPWCRFLSGFWHEPVVAWLHVGRALSEDQVQQTPAWCRSRR